METLKKCYHLVAGLALVNALALVGGLCYLIADGRLDATKIRAIVAMFKPVEEGAGEAAAEKTPEQVAAGETAPQASQVEREMARLNLERITRTAEDRLRYVSRLILDTERRREALEKEKTEAEQELAAEARREADEAFRKDLEVLSVLKPKVALDALLARPVDEAARSLLALDERTVKKIVEAASKDDRKWQAMQAIQERMRAMDFPVALERTTAAAVP